MSEMHFLMPGSGRETLWDLLEWLGGPSGCPVVV